ncbi:MAG: corrinoid protein [Syntrophomonas sp.]|jgi:corrinoid protein of di/trimethylamine methyltransferase|uniref:cobalamin B12-binding domain-containing protein n=1 Tax=Syntrophomonas sp. TaxID=2053627 RepID=UPI0026307308|nr:corrinoid protein [Syntrophomonas sp.]MDD2510406.1 corrinoid protein [Syntrophomonas sp.]MDD3879130.1 corrinoid protein [Syntrophomonas sp.]MDD4625576.1 corrinoid protein [Syntrophomonas sp.]
MKREEILEALAQAVVVMDEEDAVRISRLALQAGISAEDAIENGLSQGMAKVGELFDSNEYFIPEVVVCADTMYKGLEVLKTAVTKAPEPKGRIVIGVVEGDTHDIGKNIVAMLLESAGFEIHDLGRNVPAAQFVDRALQVDADIVAMSSLMTTTMEEMKIVIEKLRKNGEGQRPYCMVGGAPISKSFADSIGADAYAANAPAAVKMARQLMERKGETRCD